MAMESVSSAAQSLKDNEANKIVPSFVTDNQTKSQLVKCRNYFQIPSTKGLCNKSLPSRKERLIVCRVTHSCNYLKLISAMLNMDISSSELIPICKGEAIRN